MKYKKVKLPAFAINNFRSKKLQMEKEYQKIYKEKKEIPMTKIICYMSTLSMFVSDEQLKKFAKRRFSASDLL